MKSRSKSIFFYFIGEDGQNSPSLLVSSVDVDVDVGVYKAHDASVSN